MKPVEILENNEEYGSQNEVLWEIVEGYDEYSLKEMVEAHQRTVQENDKYRITMLECIIQNFEEEIEEGREEEISENSEYHKFVAKFLGKVGDERGVKTLIKMLELYMIYSDKEAEAALVKFGEPAVQPLITALGIEPSRFIIGRDVREAAIITLLKIGEPSIKPLKKALNSKNENVSHAAKLALKKFEEGKTNILAAERDSLADYRRK